MDTPLVSVLVPVYNVAQYIERCARSLFEQTLQNVEYVFVDDCTPDNSIEILQQVLEDYPQRKPLVRIIHHETNQSVGTARKTAALSAIGEYIIFVDSDDYIDRQMLEIMYNSAIDNKCDLVQCDYFEVIGDSVIPKSFVDESDPLKCAAIIYSCNGKMKPYTVNKMVKREIIQSEKFILPEGISIAEDHIISIQYFYYAKKILHINKALYYYDIHVASLSHSYKLEYSTRKANDIYKAYLIVTDFAETHFPKSLLTQQDIRGRQIHTKDNVLKYLDKNNRKKWYGLFPEMKINFFEKPYRFRCKLGIWGTTHHCAFLYELYLWGNQVLSALSKK